MKIFYIMVYILNTNLKDSQKVRIALQDIYGIGKFLSNQICDQLGFSDSIQIKSLTSFQKDQLIRIINQYYFTGSELRRIALQDIKRLTNIASYRGFRHVMSLPVRGQRTKTNARTRKKRNRERTIA